MTDLRDLLEKDLWPDMVEKLNSRDTAHLILLMVGQFTDHDSRKLKELALELAEEAGPDHCQTLYRLAVLATKLA